MNIESSRVDTINWRQILNIPMQPEKNGREQKITYMTENAAVIASVKHNTLPDELAELIEAVGELYKADHEDIADMKSHVLNFINTKMNGLLIALNGFQILANEFAT